MSANTIQSDDQLAITSYGLQAVTGNQDFALFGSIAAMMSAVAEDPEQMVASQTKENSYEPALTAPIPNLDDIEPDVRMLFFLLNVLIEATDNLLQKKLEDKKHLLLIVIPASVFARSEYVDTKEWQKSLLVGLPEFTDLHFHFINADDNVTKHLQTACASLSEGKLESVIFSGSDSLLDQETCKELMQQNRLRSNTITDGVIPGEAAACVVIQKINTQQQSRAILKGLNFVAEPNCSKAHMKKMSGLSSAIQAVIQMAQQQHDEIDCIIRNHSSEQHYSFEWYQTTQTVWPNKLPEQQRVAYQLGELDEPPKLKPRNMPEELFTSITLGEIGAASIPLSLVLACARFNFNYPTVKNCIVCEVTEFPFRGAILLENPNN